MLRLGEAGVGHPAVANFGRWFRRVAGSVQSICAEAVRAGRRWLHGLTPARWAFGAG